MLRLCFGARRYLPSPPPSSSSSSSSNSPADASNSLEFPTYAALPPIIQRHNNGFSPKSNSSSLGLKSAVVLSATLASAAVASYALVHRGDHGGRVESKPDRNPNPLHDAVEAAVHKSDESLRMIFHRFKQTGVAASVLWQSLRSVLSSANHEVRLGFASRVASFLADIAAANAARRTAVVDAGGGAVVDWLLETVAGNGSDGSVTQAEAARALAYLIADPDVSGAVLGRPNAVPYLLQFIFSCQPNKKHSRRSSLGVSDSLKGRSMLVAAIMDIVTSNCDSLEEMSFRPALSGNAALRDIAAAIEVIEEGGLHLDRPGDDEDDNDDGRGIKGIGIKILEGTAVLGLTRTNGLAELEHPDSSQAESTARTPKALALLHKHDNLPAQRNVVSAVVPGLWDDLHCDHVAVPFAAWALANWAMASEVNRSHIHELDQDGQAVMAALLAPERSVKWHASLVARLLLEDQNLPLNGSISDWSSSLLSTIAHASKNEDIPLCQVALSAFLLSVERSPGARKKVAERGLPLMRDIVKQTKKHKQVQESLAKALEFFSTGDVHLSFEESQRWSGIMLPWVFGKFSSDAMRASATNFLSRILEDHGPSSIPISQGWLAVLLNEALNSSNASSAKGGSQPKSDKVKTQVDQSNVVFATAAANQLAGSVVNRAVIQEGTTESVDAFPLSDLLSLEPLAGPRKNLKKDTVPKLNVADSAEATVKGIKALTELCSEDHSCQEKIVDFGVFCLLRRFLLCDDYEKLAAMETYDASRSLETQHHASNATNGESKANGNSLSSVRVPPTAHMRRHAARLLTVLSPLRDVQKAIVADKALCKWLEDCADGKLQGCGDAKMQSYARAILLNVFCNYHDDIEMKSGRGPETGATNRKHACPIYDDVMFLVRPDLAHWKRCEKMDYGTVQDGKTSPAEGYSVDNQSESVKQGPKASDHSDSTREFLDGLEPDAPEIDVIFVHGLRGGPFKSWRISEDKTSTKSGLVEKIDEEAGKHGTFWPGEWLSADIPRARLFTLKYKTNLTQWSGATLPLQEVSSMLLEKLVAAGIGNRPVVFVTHSMGGLVVKQILHKAKTENINNLVNNTVGIVFYSCPHFGSKLADMPWRMGLVLRPAPSIGELRSGSPWLVELNDFLRQREKKKLLQVLSFCETKVTPIVEGYGGWAFRAEIVPMESAYPGYGKVIVLESTDHINSCKPMNRNDPSYTEVLKFLKKLKSLYS
ncbi:Protein SERAC1 [Linum perenne]